MEYNLKEKKNEYSLIFTIVRFSTECRKLNLGGGALPIMDYTGRLSPERGSFFRMEVYKRVGISRVEEERDGKTFI